MKKKFEYFCRSFGSISSINYSFDFLIIVLSLLVLLSVAISGQRDAKWNWSSNNRNDINEPRDQPINRRKFERLEDFR